MREIRQPERGRIPRGQSRALSWSAAPCEGAGQAEFMRVLRSAERSRNAGDADQGSFGVCEVTDDETVR
jgi:hypothetical protein